MCIMTAINLINMLALCLLSLSRVCEGRALKDSGSLMVQMDNRSV